MLQTRSGGAGVQGIGRCPGKLGRGGTNLPGKLALKIDKNILGELSRGVKVTVVTGTNGKTTTSRMIEQAFADAGLKYFSNKSGANLLTGIIDGIRDSIPRSSGKCPYTHALIECDEAAVPQHKRIPAGRMSGRATTSSATSLTATARSRTRWNAIREGHHACSGCDAVPERGLLADRFACGRACRTKIVWFGVEQCAASYQRRPLTSCPTRRTASTARPNMSTITSPTAILAASAARSAATTARRRRSLSPRRSPPAPTRSDIILAHLRCTTHEVHVNLPGGYNIYNAAAAAAVAHVVGIDEQTAVSALAQFECGFGRAGAVQARPGTGAHDAGQESCRLQSGHQPDRAR